MFTFNQHGIYLNSNEYILLDEKADFQSEFYFLIVITFYA